MTTVKPLKCGFCGKPNQEVRILVLGGHGRLICDRCTERVVAHVDKERQKRRADRLSEKVTT